MPPDRGGGLQKLAAEADPKSTAVRVFSGKNCVSFLRGRSIEVRTSNKERGVVVATLAVVVLP